MVVEASRGADGVKSVRSHDMQRLLQPGMSRSCCIENLYAELSVREEIARELGMGVYARGTAALPAHHDRLPPRFGTAPQIGVSVRRAALVAEIPQGMSFEPSEGEGFDSLSQLIADGASRDEVLQRGEKLSAGVFTGERRRERGVWAGREFVSQSFSYRIVHTAKVVGRHSGRNSINT